MLVLGVIIFSMLMVGRGDDLFLFTLSGGSSSSVVVKGGLGQDVFLNFDDNVHSSNGVVFKYENLNEIGDIVRSFDDPDQFDLLFNREVFQGDSGTVDGVVDAAHFVSNTSGEVVDSDDFWLYSTVNDKLFYDPDGTGAADKVLVVNFQGHDLSLTVSDIRFNTVTGVSNNAPKLYALDALVGIPVGSAVLLDVDVVVTDAELVIAGNYSGAGFVVQRTGGG